MGTPRVALLSLIELLVILSLFASLELLVALALNVLLVVLVLYVFRVLRVLHVLHVLLVSLVSLIFLDLLNIWKKKKTTHCLTWNQETEKDVIIYILVWHSGWKGKKLHMESELKNPRQRRTIQPTYILSLCNIPRQKNILSARRAHVNYSISKGDPRFIMNSQPSFVWFILLGPV